jgi:hypothetical protein
MDPEIRVDLPSSSPIIAYGETRQPRGNKFLALFAGGFLLIFLVAALIASLLIRVPLPDNTVLVATVHGGSSLPNGAPAVWQVAAHHPILLGLAKGEHGLVAYRVGLVSDQRTENSKIATWPFAISSDAPLSTNESRSIFEIIWSAIRLGNHQAYITLNTKPLTEANEQITGFIDDGVWKTDVRTASTNTTLPPGDVSIDLTSQPDAWPAIRDMMAQAIPGLTLNEQPTTLGWTMATDTPRIVASYASTPSTSTLLAFAEAAGLHDENELALPDGSAAVEFEPPMNTILASGTAALTSASGTQLHISDQTISFGPTDNPNSPVNAGCISQPGIFALSGKAVQTILATWNITINSVPDGIRAFIDQGRVSLTSCSR